MAAPPESTENHVLKPLRVILAALALAALLLLAGLSIVAAFLGSAGAARIFTSAPMVGFWILLIVLTITSLAVSRRALASPGLLAMHVAIVLIIIGAMLGSAPAHALAQRWFGSQKVHSGYLFVNEGGATSVAVNRRGRPIGRLTFSVFLEDFWIERYGGPTTRPATTQPASAPTRHRHAGPIKDYKSRVIILDERHPVAERVIEVNHPLHYAGHHLYQYDYDRRRGRYTVLAVRSDTGLVWVYLGFVLLGGGAAWHFWLIPLAGARKRRTRARGN